MISLSNLLKQRYVINLENETRIINSDEKYVVGNVGMESAFSEEIPSFNDVDEDGFTSGLEAEEVYVEPQITPEEVLEQAQMQAEQILEATKAEAAQIAEDAKKEAEMLYEQQKKDGYSAGFAQSKSELEEEINRIEAEYQQLEKTLKSDYDAKFETMESDIVDAIIRVFNKVFHIQFDNKKQILLHLIKDTILNVESSKEFRIRIAESNFKFVESHIGDIKEKVGNDVNIEIVNDVSLGVDDCIIETQYGVFNCGIDMELSNLEKDIRSLC